MAKTKTDRVYLTEEEKKLLAGMLEEWNSKPNKKTQDDFISTEALPTIQQMNITTCGPEIIRKDKRRMYCGTRGSRFVCLPC